MQRPRGGFEEVMDNWARQQTPPKPPASPTLTAASAGVNYERRLEAAGQRVPVIRRAANLMLGALDIIDRPGAAIRGAVHARATGGGLREMATAAQRGFTGKEKKEGTDIIRALADRGVPVAQTINRTGVGRFVGGLAANVLLDPLTYIGVGKFAQPKRRLADNIAREVAKETGEKISRETAENLARRATEGFVQDGKIGTAVRRAMGYTAETRQVKTNVARLARAEEVAKGKARIGELASAADEATAASRVAREAADETVSVWQAQKRDTVRAATADKQKAETALKQARQAAKAYDDQARAQVKTAAEEAKKAGATAQQAREAIRLARQQAQPQAEALAKNVEAAKKQLSEARNVAKLANKTKGAPDAKKALREATRQGVEKAKNALKQAQQMAESHAAQVKLQVKAATGEAKKAGATAQQMREAANLARKQATQRPDVLTKAVQGAKSRLDEARRIAGLAHKSGMDDVKKTQIADFTRQAATKADEAKRLADEAAKAKKDLSALRKTPVQEATVQRTVYTGKPVVERTAVHFMGRPLIDVTPIKTAAGGIIAKSPTMTLIRDNLGRFFQTGYIPQAYKGTERAKIAQAKEVVADAMREAPHARKVGMREAAGEWARLGVDEELAKQIPGVVQKTAQGTAETRRLAQVATRLFNEDVKRLAEVGIDVDTIDNYVQHLYNAEPKKAKEILAKWRAGRKTVPGARPGFLFHKSIPDIETAKALGLEPVEDVRHINMVHRAMANQAITMQKMGRELIGLGQDVIRNTDPGGWINVTDTTIPALKGKWVHPEVNESLRKLYPILSNEEESMHILFRLMDSFHRGWKSMVLFRPSFHARQAAGNVFLNMIDGVTNPLRYSQATAVMYGALPEVTLAGRTVPVSTVRDWFSRYALEGQGAFREVLGGRTRTITREAKVMLDALERQGFGKVAHWLNSPFEASRMIGENTDSLARMTNFLHHLDNGLSPAEAAKRTRAALFDYSELTDAERAIKRVAMPFYTWTRKSLPRMVEGLIGTPGAFSAVGHLRRTMVDLNDVDEENLPQHLRDAQAIPLWVDGKGRLHYLTLNLPLTELSRIVHPLDYREALRDISTMISPIFNLPAQMATNRSFLTGRPITEFPDLPGRAARDYAGFLISQFGMPREIVVQLRADEQQRLYEQAVATGKAPEIEPIKRSLASRIIGLTSPIDPAATARAATFRRSDILGQGVKEATLRGVPVPETADLPPLGEPDGFAEVMERHARSQRGQREGKLAFLPPDADFATVMNTHRLQDKLREITVIPDALGKAMQQGGVDHTWGPWLVLLMRHESQGNPVAVNRQWVEYNTGRTSDRRMGEGWYQRQGLFQLMRPTFERFKVEGHNDIFNPIHNTLAAINYIRSKYKHPANIPNIGDSQYRGF